MSTLFPWLDWSSFAPTNLNQPILPGWSLLSITENNSSAPDTEKRIVAQDSYGRQIGKLMDAVCVLMAEAEKTNPALKTNAKLTALGELKDRIDAIKHEAQKARQNRLIDDLQALKIQDHERFDAVIRAVSKTS